MGWGGGVCERNTEERNADPEMFLVAMICTIPGMIIITPPFPQGPPGGGFHLEHVGTLLRRAKTPFRGVSLLLLLVVVVVRKWGGFVWRGGGPQVWEKENEKNAAKSSL